MINRLPLEGKIAEGDLYPLLYNIYKHGISGLLVVHTDQFEKQLVIQDRKIVFAVSTLKEDAFGEHLLRHQIISKEIYAKTTQHMLNHNIRFGRSLIELGYLNYDQIWTYVQDHLKSIIYSFFTIKTCHYQILVDYERDIENIVLDIDIIDLIVEGMRHFKSNRFLENKFSSIKFLYACNTKMLTHMKLRPYEMHVFDLVKRGSKLSDIIKRSELLEEDTLRMLYLFMVLEVISEKRQAINEPDHYPEEMPESPSVVSVFTSFEEALKHYNTKYELIYKTLSKEIGPIALSLLWKSIEDIMDNLPPYLQKVQLNSDGKISENSIVKSLWYHDFEKNIGDFLRGLEEILYTEVFAVKKHLGVDYEQQVLKWINASGS